MSIYSTLSGLNKLAVLVFLCILLLPLHSSSKKTPKKETLKEEKIIELIEARKSELNDRISDLNDLHRQGLVTIYQAEPLKTELKELDQFEFIIQNPFTGGYEGTLQEKLENSVESMKSQLKIKESLWAEGLISTRELRALEEKAAIYNYILGFLSDESRMPLFLLQNKGLTSKAILGRFYRIESPFGFRSDPINGRRKQFHAGVDFAAWTGTPIKSPYHAKVVKVINSPYSGGGRQVKLKHAKGFETVYMHLSKVKVATGEVISAGEVIGYVGSSGKRVTGPHLHFELHLNGIPVNPAKYLK